MSKKIIDLSEVKRLLDLVMSEMYETVDKLGEDARFNSPHEGYAVILEELDEMWEAIKKKDISHSRKEAIQVAATAVRYLYDFTDSK